MGIQRRLGRGTKLTIALFLLGTSTAGIAFLPGYASLGFASIVLLSIFRVGQGIALGGSWDGLPSLLALSAPPGPARLVRDDGAAWRTGRLHHGQRLFLLLYASLSIGRLPLLGLALSVLRRLRDQRGGAVRAPAAGGDQRVRAAARASASWSRATSASCCARSGTTWSLGAFAALASFALFHLVTVFPLSWILLYSTQTISRVSGRPGHRRGAGALAASSPRALIADRIGRRRTVGAFAILIAVFSGFAPTLLDGGTLGQDVFILLGFILLGLSYGQAAGAMNVNFEARYRYVGAALTADLAWLFGAGLRTAGCTRSVRQFRTRLCEPLPAFGRCVHPGGVERRLRAAAARVSPPPGRALFVRAGPSRRHPHTGCGR